MHGRILAVAMMAVLAASGPMAGAGAAAGPVHGTPLERAVMREMNVARAAHGRTPLRGTRILAAPARSHSAFLARTGGLRHESASGAPFWTRLVAAGFPRTKPMGENIGIMPGCDGAAARRVVAMWLASPGHRANLLSPRFRVAGVGAVTTAGCRTTVITADYGGPR